MKLSSVPANSHGFAIQNSIALDRIANVLKNQGNRGAFATRRHAKASV